MEVMIMVEMVVAAFIVGILGLIFMGLGYLMWRKERISLLHSYHYDKVSPEDKKAFCALSGIGVLFIGLGLVVTAVIIGMTDSAWSFIALAIGFLVGLAFLVYAGIKYNR